MTKQKHSTPRPSKKRSEAYTILDKPVANPRYGRMTMREAMLSTLKGEKPKPKSRPQA